MSTREEEHSVLTSVAVVMTVYNRRVKTLACLTSLFEQSILRSEIDLTVTVVDDLSTDGTADAVSTLAHTGDLSVITTSGNYFWARGMELGMSHAARSKPDFILWLNDDVQLDNDALARAIQVSAEAGERCIIVGATRSQVDGAITYAGARLTGRRPGSLQIVEPSDTPTSIDAFHGNFVLTSRFVYETLGTIDGAYEHAYGDIDYGLRARAAGVPMLLAPGTFGTCESNPVAGTWRSVDEPRIRRLQGLFGVKGYPIKSHWRFNMRHGGLLGPAYFAATYARSLLAIGMRKSI